MSEQIPLMDIPVSVDADMDKIKALTEMFEAYSKATKGTPLKLPAEMTVEQRELVAGKAGGGARDGKGKDSSPGLEKTLKEFAKGFGELIKGLKQTATYLKGIFESTLKWTLGFGLLGGLGTMGYGRLLNETVNNVQGARGLDVPTGMLMASGNVYSQFGSVETLRALNEAKHNAAKKTPLLGLGLDPNDTSLPQLYQRTWERYTNADPQTLMNAYEGRHLNELYSSFENFNRVIAAGNAGELPRMEQLFWKQAKSLNIDPEASFNAQMLLAQTKGNVDEVIKTFVERMGGLNGPLGNLSDKVKDSVIAFINGKGFANLVTSAGESLNTFVKWLGTPEGTKAVKDFGNSIVVVTGKVMKLTTKLAQLLGNDDHPKKLEAKEDVQPSTLAAFGAMGWRLAGLTGLTPLATSGKALGGVRVPWLTGLTLPLDKGYPAQEGGSAAIKGTAAYENKVIAGALYDLFKFLYPDPDTPAGGIQNTPVFSRDNLTMDWLSDEEPEQHAQAAKRRPKMSSGDQKALLEHFASLENTYGLPENWLYALAMVESSMNPMAVSEKGAAGMFQFMPRTAPEYGLVGTDVFDPYKSAQAAAKMSAGLLKKYHGDPQKALAAYNWGQGNVDLFGLNHRPNQTREHFRRFQSYMSAPVRPPYPAPSDGQSMHIPVSGSAGTHIIQVEVRSSPGSDFITQLAAQNHGIAY